jgi:hypothetical protein
MEPVRRDPASTIDDYFDPKAIPEATPALTSHRSII